MVLASDIVGQLNQYLNDRFADGADWRADPKSKQAVILVVESAGLKWDTVYRWLTGRRTPPTAGLVQLARGLMIDADWLPYDVGKDVPTSIPNGPMRADDVRARLRGIIDERFEKNQPALRRLIEKAAGYRWDTFYRKLRGSLAITEADVTRLAVAFGVMPRWLATGDGARENEWTRLYFDAIAWNPEDRPVGHPLVPPDGLVTGRWVDPYIKCRPQDRPRTRPPQFIMGPRVTRRRVDVEPEPLPTRTVCGLPEMERRLHRAKPKGMRKLLDKFVTVELEQPEPRKDALLIFLKAAQPWEAAKPPEERCLTNELTAALKNLDDAEAEPPP